MCIRDRAINGYLTKELQDLNIDTIRTDIPTSSTVTDVIVWHIEQSGTDTFSVTYEVDQQIKEGEQTSNVKAVSYTHLDVYKRQEYFLECRVSDKRQEYFSNKGGKWAKFCFYMSLIVSILLIIIGCLLYTSRCV